MAVLHQRLGHAGRRAAPAIPPLRSGSGCQALQARQLSRRSWRDTAGDGLEGGGSPTDRSRRRGMHVHGLLVTRLDPGTIRMSARSRAAGPPTRSRVVGAMTRTPLRSARATTSAGASDPSEAVEWRCRSTVEAGTTRPPASAASARAPWSRPWKIDIEVHLLKGLVRVPKPSRAMPIVPDADRFVRAMAGAERAPAPWRRSRARSSRDSSAITHLSSIALPFDAIRTAHRLLRAPSPCRPCRDRSGSRDPRPRWCCSPPP